MGSIPQKQKSNTIDRTSGNEPMTPANKTTTEEKSSLNGQNIMEKHTVKLLSTHARNSSQDTLLPFINNEHSYSYGQNQKVLDICSSRVRVNTEESIEINEALILMTKRPRNQYKINKRQNKILFPFKKLQPIQNK